MAEKIKLRDYQKSILDKLETVRTDTSDASVRYLGVEIGETNVLINLLDISETLVVSDIKPVPLVKPWFLGMTNVRGVLYAINDLSQLLEGVFTEISSDTRMILINENVSSNIGVLVTRLIGLRNLTKLKKRQGKKKDHICFKQEHYVDEEKRVWSVLDCERLVGSKEFEVPYEA